MESADLQGLVAQRLEEMGLGPIEAATRGGLERTFIRDIVSGKKKSIRGDNLRRLAKALGVDPGALAVGRLVKASAIPLVGFVGPDGEVQFGGESAAAEGTPVPEIAGARTVAIEIRSDSLGAFLKGWLAIYDDLEGPVTEELEDTMCVVRLTDGRVMIRRIRRAQAPGRFHLLSQAEPPVLDAELVWAERVKALVPG